MESINIFRLTVIAACFRAERVKTPLCVLRGAYGGAYLARGRAECASVFTPPRAEGQAAAGIQSGAQRPGEQRLVGPYRLDGSEEVERAPSLTFTAECSLEGAMETSRNLHRKFWTQRRML